MTAIDEHTPSQQKRPLYLRVQPLRPIGILDYRHDPEVCPANLLVVGARVFVPLGTSVVMGIIESIEEHTEVASTLLKPIFGVVDGEPVRPDNLALLFNFTAEYYFWPLGEVYRDILPKKLIEGLPLAHTEWRTSQKGLTCLTKARTNAQQPAELDSKDLHFLDHSQVAADIKDARKLLGASWKKKLVQLTRQGLIHPLPPLTRAIKPHPVPPQTQPLTPTPSQSEAIHTFITTKGYTTFCLQGVTGSGKTLVYQETIAHTLRQGMQALVLIPEVALTPQTVTRFQQAFGTEAVEATHYRRTPEKRFALWNACLQGELPVLIGTRSAIFTPFRKLGLIIVDEEHDTSFKQEDAMGYSARDLAVYRAKNENIPLILGSATPSFETLHNVRENRFHLVELKNRAGNARPPTIELLDLRRQPLSAGLTDRFLKELDTCLEQQQLALVFLNRRGYAPAVICHECGWLKHCPRCTVPLTLHRGDQRMRCHHCGWHEAIPRHCGNHQCGSAQLLTMGYGVEQVAELLSQRYPEARIVRFDRDSLSKKGALEEALQLAREQGPRILVGTQMLAKGHDFSDLSLVGIVNADQGLFSVDFRAQERLLALILQVAGRAGRGDIPGKVFVQTHHPEHPLLQALVKQATPDLTLRLLHERQETGFPPFGALAILHAAAKSAADAEAFLHHARTLFSAHHIQAHGPLPAPIERKESLYRLQCWLQAPRKEQLHSRIKHAWPEFQSFAQKQRRVRWRMDVDPQFLI